MSDRKWGFEKEYGHRHLPFKWHQSSGYSLYNPDPLTKKSFRRPDLPVYRQDLIPKNTSYVDREQDAKNAMSGYGCHRELPWTTSLRMERKPLREVRELVPSWKVGAPLNTQRATPRSFSVPSGRCRATPEDLASALRFEETLSNKAMSSHSAEETQPRLEMRSQPRSEMGDSCGEW